MIDTPKNDMLDMFAIDMPPEANLQLADSQLVNYYLARKNRTIYLTREIDGSLWEEIQLIIQWNREDEENKIPVEERKPIKLLIHSFGGEVDSCFSLIDVMNLSKTPIITVNMNCAMSAGCIIFINGHKRYSMPLSTCLIHQGSGGSSGGYDQVVAQTENYKKIMQMMKDNIIEHTKITKQQLTKNSKKEWYIYADEQVELGLSDKIVTDITEIL